MAQEFEWDPEKNEKNIIRHKLNFEDVVTAFDSLCVEYLDDRKDYGELRWIRLAQLRKAVIVLVYTYRKHKIRIISARKASHYERKIYYRKIEEGHQLEVASTRE